MEKDQENRMVVNDPVDWTKLTRSRLNAKFLLACTVCDLRVVRQAIEHGADVNCRRTDYLTSLHIAAEHGDVKLMQFLCGVGNVRPDAKTMHGLTPLHTAALLGHTRVITELLRAGATLNCEDNLGRSPLHYAALAMDLECARFLLEYGALVHAHDAFEESPLYISVIKTRDILMTKLLLGYRRQRRPFPLKDAQSLLMQAVLSARDAYDMDIIKTILHYSDDIINLSDPIGWRTPLHVAALTGFYQLAEYLIDNGANLHAKNRANQTPLQVALNCKNFHVVRLLDQRLTGMNDDSSEDS